MSLNLFGKVYLAPDYLYDNAYDRIIFSQERNQAEYLNYDSFDMAGFNSEVIYSGASINNIIGDAEKQYQSIAHYLKHLYDTGFEGRIYADEESWLPIFFSWIKIALPNATNDIIFVIYNTIKQREELVWPDNKDLRTFAVSRLETKNAEVILDKITLIEKLDAFNLQDTADVNFYNDLRLSLMKDLSVEIQIASYLAGVSDISIISDKIKIIYSKVVFNVLNDLKDYIRDNIMTENVKTLTGVDLSWEDQNWQQTLEQKSEDMGFLFDSSVDSLNTTAEYRLSNIDKAIKWCEWVLANFTSDLENDIELFDIKTASQHIVDNANCFSLDSETSLQAIQNLIEFDVNYSGTTLIFQTEYLRDKINTFLIEYIYQMKKNNNIEGLKTISHT